MIRWLACVPLFLFTASGVSWGGNYHVMPVVPPIEDRISLEPELMSGTMIISWTENIQIGFPILELRYAGPFQEIEENSDLWYFTLEVLTPVQYIVLPEPTVWRTTPNGEWHGYVRRVSKTCRDYDFVNLRCKIEN